MKNFLLILLLSGQIGFSQSTKIDSLKAALISIEKIPKNNSTAMRRCTTLNAIMRAYSDINIDSSMRYNILMTRHCLSNNLEKELIFAYQFAGYLHQVRGDYIRSAQFYIQALRVAEKQGSHKGIAGSHRGIAHAYLTLEQFRVASRHCDLGLQALKISPDSYTELGILNVQGEIYRKQRKWEAALQTNFRMHDLAKRTNEKWYESQGFHDAGWVYMDMSSLDSALVYFNKALILSRQMIALDLEQSILLHIADVYILQKKWDEATKVCLLVKKEAIKMNNSSILSETEEHLYRIYRSTGQLKNALVAHENFISIKDSISKEKADQRIESLKAQFDNIKKTSALQKQDALILGQKNKNQLLALTRNILFIGIVSIVIIAGLLFGNNRRLQAKNRQIEEQRVLLEKARQQLSDVNKILENKIDEGTRQLVQANWELIRKNGEIKEAIFKGQAIERKRVAVELHDNVSSLLSAVNMSIQSINTSNLSESQQSTYRNVKQLIQNAYSEVRNISHNILPADLEKEGLVKTLTVFLNRLNQNSATKFTLTTTNLQERLPVEIEFNIYSIALELVTNAIKHAQATSVLIHLLRTEYGIQLSVIDDGIGMVENKTTRGIGLQNIQNRLESLGGTFITESQAEQGTRIDINIPIEAVSFNGNV